MKFRYNPDIHHRKSIRLKNYDYSQNGAYFITICSQNKENLFGKISDDGRGTKFCALTNAGKIVEQCWWAIPIHYPDVILDEFVVMPNHVHGIIMIKNNKSTGAQNFEPLRKANQFQNIVPRSIGAIIRGYKTGVTKWMRNNSDIYQVWQRNYYEHIIRNETELNSIREYVMNNTLKWADDENNPENL